MTAARPYTIVVGVSSTSRSPAALRWALDEAAHRNGVVIALRAWRPPRPNTATGARPPLPEAASVVLFDRAQAELERDVSDVLGSADRVECRLVHGGRRKALRSISSYADLLVIDAPQRTDLRTAPLFARRLIYTARCPVVVMPPDIAEQSDTPVVAAGKRIGRTLLDAAGTAGRPGIRPVPGSGTAE